MWRLQDASGVWCTLYVDDNGVLRITRAAAVNALNPRPGRDVREIAGFELHDGVTTELATIGDADRFFFSAEDEAGQPHRYIEAADLAADYGMVESYPTDNLEWQGAGGQRSATFAHNLGRVPKLILAHGFFSGGGLTNEEVLIGPPGWYEHRAGANIDTIQIQPTSLTSSEATIWASIFYQ